MTLLIAGNTFSAATNSVDPSSELMQSTLQALASTPALPEPIARIYNESKSLLDKSQNQQAQRAQLETEMQHAPERQLQLQQLLDKDIHSKKLVPPTSDTTLEETEQLYSIAQGKLFAAERDQTSKSDRIREQERLTATLPDAMSAAAAALDTAKLAQGMPLPEDEPPGLSGAESIRRKSALLSAETAISLFETERAYTSTMGGIIQSELTLASRNLDQAKIEEQFWLKILEAKREALGFEWTRRTKEQRDSFEGKDPSLTALCAENVQFAKNASAPDGVIDQVQKANIRRNEAVDLLSELNGDFDDIQTRLQLTGMNKAVGNLLIRHRNALPVPQDIQRKLSKSRQDLNNAQLLSLQLREGISDARKDGAILQNIRAQLDLPSDSTEWFSIEQDAWSILRLRRDLLTEIAKTNAKLEQELSATIVAEQKLLRTIEDMGRFVDEQVLWTRNMHAFGKADIKILSNAIRTAEIRKFTRTFIAQTWKNIKARPVRSIVLILILSMLVVARSLAHKKIDQRGLRVIENPPGSISNTMKTVLLTLFSSMIWPLVLWAGSEWMETSDSAEDIVFHVSAAMKTVAYYLLPILLLLEFTRSSGLSIIHLKFSPLRITAIRKLLILIICICIPWLIIRSLAETYPANATFETLGRLSTIIGQLFLATIYAVVFRHNGPFVEQSTPTPKQGLIYQHWMLWYAPIVLSPFLLAVASAAGFQYSSMQIGIRLNGMTFLMITLFICQAIITRAIWLLRRKRLKEEVQKRKLAGLETENEAALELQKDLLKETVQGVTSASDGIVHLVRLGLWALLIMGLYLMWWDMLPAFRFLDHTDLYQVGEVKVTLGGFLAAIITSIVGSIIVRTLPGMLEVYILPRTKLHPGERSAIATLIKYLLVMIVILQVCNRMGLTWSSMHWLIAAMGVGLGFGLQEIFANLFCGIMLLMDGRIRPMDIVTVGESTGRVTAIRTLATTVTDWNNRELVIPNKEFVTGRVTNWTLSEQIVRLDIPVGVAYGSDTDRVTGALLRAGRENEHTLNDPPPEAMFMEFADSSLNFELRVWVNMEKRLVTRDALNRSIDNAFRKADITIAFPQLDLHVKSPPHPNIENPEPI